MCLSDALSSFEPVSLQRQRQIDAVVTMPAGLDVRYRQEGRVEKKRSSIPIETNYKNALGAGA